MVVTICLDGAGKVAAERRYNVHEFTAEFSQRLLIARFMRSSGGLCAFHNHLNQPALVFEIYVVYAAGICHH